MEINGIVREIWYLSCVFLFQATWFSTPCEGLLCHVWTSSFDGVLRHHCYWYISLNSKTAQQGDNNCANSGGSLAPYIDEEQSAVLKQVLDEWPSSLPSLSWIGVNDMNKDAVWVNWNGDPTSVRDSVGHGNWKNNQPNGKNSAGFSSGQSDQDCVAVSPSYKWEDKNCNERYGGALCYKEYSISESTVPPEIMTTESTVPPEIMTTESTLPQETMTRGKYRLDRDKTGVLFLESMIFSLLVTRLNPCFVQCNIFKDCESVVFNVQTNMCYGYNKKFAGMEMTVNEPEVNYYYRI